MELFFFCLGLILLATLILPWVNHFRISSTRDDIEHLKQQVVYLESMLSAKHQPYVAEQEAPADTKALTEQLIAQARAEKYEDEEIEEEIASAAVAPREFAPEPQERVMPAPSRFTFEQNIATKLPVWIGAISLICAAFFLVKYSIELGWLSPLVRVSLGAGFGAILLGAGQWIGRRQYIANSTRIGQGLVGAGLVALYVSLYAAINLYNLMPPVLGFGSMAVVTAMAVILSLRHGQPIAIFGLVGGLVTPAMVGSDEPNAIVMFTYLFLLFSGMFMVLARKGWWLLAIIAVLGVFSWTAFWLCMFGASDAFILVLFGIGITGVVLAVTGQHIAKGTQVQKRMPMHGVNMAAIAGGIATIVWLSFYLSLSLFDWSMLGLLSAALIGLAYFRADIYQKPLWVKLGADLILFAIWAQDAPFNDTLAVIAGIGAVYIGGGALIMRQVSDPRFWAAVQTVAALALYVISYYVLELPADYKEPFGMFWGSISLVLAGLAAFQAAEIRKKFKADSVIEEHLVAIYALAASAFISLGLSIELPWEYVPQAIAAQIATTAWLYQRSGIAFLKKIIVILVLVFAGMTWTQLLLFASLIVNSIGGEIPETYTAMNYALDNPLLKLGIPAIFISLALLITTRRDTQHETFVHTLVAAAGALILAVLYYMFRGLTVEPGANIFLVQTGFVDRGFITMGLAGMGAGIMYFTDRMNFDSLSKWGKGLFHLAMLRIGYYDLYYMNPFWDRHQFVGDIPVLNGVTLTYGLGTLLAGWAVYSKTLSEGEGLKKLYKGLGFVTLFAFSTFTVAQYFHGTSMFQGSITGAELYSYSVAWLVTGLALLSIGIHWKIKSARMASLAFLILTVFKVFLIDAAELEGLYRVFSFLGLGLSLIGLSFFYTKFVFKSARLSS